MEGKELSDAECLLILEEEKRLCETDIQFLKGTLKKGISIKDGETVKNDRSVPSIRLGRKLVQKNLYKDTNTESIWKLVSDKDAGKLYAFLQINFPETKAPTLHFSFDMSTKLERVGEGKKIKIGGIELIEISMEFKGCTGTILQWMKLLISSEGDISINDGEEPSIGTNGIPVDIPRIILRYFDDIIMTGGKTLGEGHKIIAKEKNLKDE